MAFSSSCTVRGVAKDPVSHHTVRGVAEYPVSHHTVRGVAKYPAAYVQQQQVMAAWQQATPCAWSTLHACLPTPTYLLLLLAP